MRSPAKRKGRSDHVARPFDFIPSIYAGFPTGVTEIIDGDMQTVMRIADKRKFAVSSQPQEHGDAQYLSEREAA